MLCNFVFTSCILSDAVASWLRGISVFVKPVCFSTTRKHKIATNCWTQARNCWTQDRNCWTSTATTHWLGGKLSKVPNYPEASWRWPQEGFENAHQMTGKLWWGIAHFFSEWASNFWRIRRRETEVLVGRWLLILPSCSMRSVGGILRFQIMKVEICEKGFFRFAMLWNHFEPEAEKPPDVLFQKTYPQFDWASLR